jgi:hypothetical protein
MQIGDMDDTSVDDPEKSADAIKALDEYARAFQTRNPNLHVVNMVMHLDEKTPHLHIDYIPVAKMNRGMSIQNSLTQALKQMGISVVGSYDSHNNETQEWQKRERAAMTEIANRHGIEITVKGEKRRDYDLPEYKAMRRELENAQRELDSLHSLVRNMKNDTDHLLKEKSGYIDTLISKASHADKLQTQIDSLQQQLGLNEQMLRSPMKLRVYSDDDKRAYVSAQMDKAGISYIEETLGFSAPEWAQAKIDDIEKRYVLHPQTFRYKLALDIDRLVYAVGSLGSLGTD